MTTSKSKNKKFASSASKNSSSKADMELDDVIVEEVDTEFIADADYGRFFGELFAFNNSLKLFHWRVSGPGSYAKHMALDMALDSLIPILDRLVETSIAMFGDLDINIPQTSAPRDIEEHCSRFFDYLDEQSDMFDEDFSGSIIEDYQEAVQQLLYRLKRLQ